LTDDRKLVVGEWEGGGRQVHNVVAPYLEMYAEPFHFQIFKKIDRQTGPIKSGITMNLGIPAL